MKIDITDIIIGEDRREVDNSKISQIADSISEVGLINPITLKKQNEKYLLIAGMHRLEAVKKLNKESIKANIVTGTQLEMELIEIDENLIRNELHYIDSDILTARRKEIYEEMYPETKHGMRNGQTSKETESDSLEKPSFVKDTSSKTGQSETIIKEGIKRSRDLTPETKTFLKERDITKTEATSLSRKKPKEQKQIVDMVTSNKVRSIKEAEEVIKPKNVHVSNNSGNNEWYTPTKFLEIARKVMGSIDTDPASSEVANKNVQAETYYTVEDNGLDKEWHGNIWMNPPYAQPLIGQFSEKLIEELDNGNAKQAMVLVNNATDTVWFNNLAQHATAIWFIKGRIKFIDIHGNPGGAPLQGQCILYFGDNVDSFADHCEGLVAVVDYRQRSD